MFRKVLIANRGEIALRVINACRELGIRTVAVYSEADRNSLHVRFADEAICIGPPRPADSYLNVPAVISAAEIADVDAIHPGYGLLSENANFAEVCRASNIKFIGPPPEVTRLMGEKEKARQAMKRAKVPILPGSDGVLATVEERRKSAERSRLSRHSQSQGRRRRARHAHRPQAPRNCPTSSMPPTLRPPTPSATASSTWKSSSSTRATSSSRFWPMSTATCATLFERECSIQRRHQKLIEEAPIAAGHAQAARGDRQDPLPLPRRDRLPERRHRRVPHGRRPQALLHRDEHPHPGRAPGHRSHHRRRSRQSAAAHRLRRTSSTRFCPPKLEIRGHAIECRINAEHPQKFTPSAGKITAFNVPGGNGVRVDTAQYAEGVVPPYYDSLIAKLIVHGVDRAEAIAKMERALSQFVVQGIDTSIPLHQEIFADEGFRAGNFDTGFMERFLAARAQSTK